MSSVVQPLPIVRVSQERTIEERRVLIAVDWGTSNFRGFRVSPDGAIIARCSSPQGILRVMEGNFEDTLREEVGVWLAAGEKNILLCGMIGSRQGWVEAEYLPCPVGIDDLADALPSGLARVVHGSLQLEQHARREAVASCHFRDRISRSGRFVQERTLLL